MHHLIESKLAEAHYGRASVRRDRAYDGGQVLPRMKRRARVYITPRSHTENACSVERPRLFAAPQVAECMNSLVTVSRLGRVI